MLPVSIGCQDSASTDSMLSETIMLHEDHDRDAGDTLMMAFEKGTFTKVCSACLIACNLPVVVISITTRVIFYSLWVADDKGTCIKVCSDACHLDLIVITSCMLLPHDGF